jgi:cytochrome c oxidase assembly protein subunit 15
MALAVDADHPLAAPRSDAMAPVRTWLFVVAALVVAMVVVGGATRLTGSGLSITEWKPVTGAVPPLSDEGWLAEFEKYRRIPQYRLLNDGMSLSEFKAIYVWEWGHRQLGRIVGLAFFLPLAWFWWRGLVRGRLALAILGIGAVGGLQAVVGWVMVASGLEPGMTAVEPVKLALHLIIACIILSALVWVATGLMPHRTTKAASRVGAPQILAGLVFIQIALGGLVAGSKAGLAYNTWPLMDGELVPGPDKLFAVTPLVENFVDNVTLVQFNHRLLAYFLLAFAVWHAVGLARRAAGSAAARRAGMLAALTLAQMAVGVTTLLLQVPLWAGLVHQCLAMLVLVAAIVHARLSHMGPRGFSGDMDPVRRKKMRHVKEEGRFHDRGNGSRARNRHRPAG